MSSGTNVMNQSKIRYEWKDIPWQKKLEVSVFKLQKRIYRASQRNDTVMVHRLQRLLIKSTSGKLLAVRRVVQENLGRKTAGIDGIANITPRERLRLAETLTLDTDSKPVRRVWIPKPGKTERRPLGIPTITDRAKQALLKLALEPEWEAKFEPNSYGFRPGRSCHDAYGAIFEALKRKTAYVLDADISGCFDNIDHNELLRKLNTTPTTQRIVKGWLKAGVMEGSVFQTTERGTPQGGVISPLLANIALHGMEDDTKKALANELFQYAKGKRGKTAHLHAQKTISIIRYADDFVITHESKDIVLKASSYIEGWLNNIGLQLKQSKTRMTHTLNWSEDQKPGFNFLGFTVRQFSVKQSKKGYKLLIKPSRESMKRHAKAIKEMLRSVRAAPQETVISKLNPIVKGWSRYFAVGVSRKAFERLDHDMHHKLWRWAKYRHPQKGKGWIIRKYFRKYGNDVWRFMTHEQMFLARHSDQLIRRHVKVKGTKSPYDGDMVYWATRLGRSLELPVAITKLLKTQKGKCKVCRFWFKTEDLMVVHKNTGKSNKREDVKLIHQSCH